MPVYEECDEKGECANGCADPIDVSDLDACAKTEIYTACENCCSIDGYMNEECEAQKHQDGRICATRGIIDGKEER
jgi:hypothetical protein